MQLNANELSHVLDVWPVARLATQADDGWPGLVPIVFVALDGVIYSAVDGKPKRRGDLQRLHNVASHPQAALLLDHYDDDWGALWWLRIHVRADVVAGAVQPAVERALRAKYRQYRDVAVFRDPPRLMRMIVAGHVAWSAGPVDWLAIRKGAKQ